MKRKTAAQENGTRVISRKLSHLVADALREKIASGALAPGDRLASETELLREFGVSRPTLREALRVVESEGLIELGRGNRTGARVLGPSIETAARYGELYLAVQQTNLGDIHQVRALLEPSLVHALAQEPKNPQLAMLRDCVDRASSALRRGDYLMAVTSTNEFHRLLARLSKNHALNLLAGIIEGIPSRIYSRTLGNSSGASRLAFERRTHESVEAHARVVALILDGEEKKAEAFWKAYQQDTGEFLRKAGLWKLKIPSSHED